MKNFTMKRIIIITGHYGSGKTEFAVNMAINLRKEHEKVALLDMDIANPYFRSRERQKYMENLGIVVHHNSYGYDITEDMPAISPALKAPLENKEYLAVVDVGGDDSGARVLNQFKKYFITGDSTMLCVINGNRPETDHLDGALEHIKKIQNETGIKIEGIINNTHLIRETTVGEIIKGYKLCSEISERMGIPIIFNTCIEELLDELKQRLKKEDLNDFAVYPIKLYMRPTWLDR